jgi:hypothetical protein
VIWFLAKNRQKATLHPKSGENGLFFEKEIAKIERVLKLFGESVATGLPVGDSFNGQIIKLLPIMSHILTWDSCYTADLKKTTLGLTPLRSNSSYATYKLISACTSL